MLMRRAFLSCLAAAFVCLCLAGCGGGNQGPSRDGGATAVVVYEVGPAEFEDSIEAQGTAKANESIMLTSRITDTVREVRFDDGDLVKEGQLIVSMTKYEEAAQLDEAIATLSNEEKQLRRIQTLMQTSAVSGSRLDDATARHGAAKARVASLQAQLADRVIVAPFDGVLGMRKISEGALVQPGTEITTLDDISKIKLDFNVPARFLASLKVGQSIRAQSEAYPGRTFTGTVSNINSRVDPVTRSVLVRAIIPNEDAALRPGMFLQVDLVRERREGLMMPEEALVSLGRSQFVFVVKDDDTVDRRPVLIGSRKPGYVEVASGVSAGEQIVLEGTSRVRPGSQVTIQSTVSAAEILARYEASADSNSVDTPERTLNVKNPSSS